MRLPLNPIAHTMLAAERQATVHLEFFHDLACPFSSKMLKVLREHVSQQKWYGGGLQISMIQVIQPWHPFSTLLHESALAVKEVAPEKFWEYLDLVAREREARFIDETTYHKTRAQIYDELAGMAAQIGIDSGAMREKLQLLPGSNMGTHVTTQLKFHVQHHRKRGVHVTPTVFINGIEAQDVSSSWTADQWDELFKTFFSPSNL